MIERQKVAYVYEHTKIHNEDTNQKADTQLRTDLDK